MRLAGKVAIITGAGSGIGRASALLFAKEGAKVVVADIDREAGERTAREIKEAGGEATFAQADVAKSAEVERMVKTCVEAFGGLDILYNNAGMPGPAGVDNVSEEDWGKVIDVNLKGVFLGCKYAVSEMRKRGGGSIISTASVAGLVGSVASPTYSASKGGVVLWTKSAAIALAKDKIRVNCVCPAPIETPMLPRFFEGLPEPEKACQNFIASLPLGRAGTPEEVAQAALFLASDESSFITGVALPVDAGHVAR